VADDAAATLARLRDEMFEAANALLPGLDPKRAFAAGALHACALKAFDAAEAGLSFHRPRQLHELAFNPNGTPRCGHDPNSDPDEHYEGDDDGEWYCESLPDGVTCSGEPGSPDGEYADWPCDEYKAILAALTGEGALRCRG
jgi:hypothetical protein